jgi:stress response protein YsnF
VSYGQQPAGYGRPDLHVGMPVSSDNGWTGTITEVIPATPGYDGAVRVAWHGDGTTLVALSTFVVENGQAIIRTQPPPPQPAPSLPAPQETRSPAPAPVAEDDLQTRLAAPVRNDPSHVNPYVSDPPLVTPEPPPIHPTHGGQFHDDDLTYVPPVSRQEPASAAIDPEATSLARAPRETTPNPYDTFGPEPANYTPPVPRETTPELAPYEAYGHEPETVIPHVPREMVAPEPGMTTPLDMSPAPMMDAPMGNTPTMAPTQQEITVPVIEEQVEAHPEWRDAGSIVVRTVMEEIPQTLTQQTEREELFVERVAIGRELTEGEIVAPREEGDTYIIPVVIEEAVVVTRRILAEELHVTKRVIPTMQTVQTVLRKERVEIDAGDLADRIHDGNGTDAANALSQASRMEPPS